MTISDEAIAKAESLGREHGTNAAAWFIQDTIGGRATGDVSGTAERILAGIEDGDPAVLDAFPSPDLSGGWASGDVPQHLFTNDNDEPIDELCATYEAAFSSAVEDEIATACRRELGP